MTSFQRNMYRKLKEEITNQKIYIYIYIQSQKQ